MALKNNGDFSTGTKLQYQLQQAPPKEFEGAAMESTEGKERVRIVEEAPPGTPYKYSCLFEYVEGDAKIAGSQRAELQFENPYTLPGEEVWVEDWFKINQYDSTHYMLLHQFHEYEAAGSHGVGVAFGLYYEGGTLKLKPGSGSSWWTNSSIVEVGRWIKIKFRVKVSETVGIVELWTKVDKASNPWVKETLANGKTTYENTNTLNGSAPGGGEKVYSKFGFLRSQEAVGTTQVIHTGNLEFNSEPPEEEKGKTGLELWAAADEQKLLLTSTGAEVSQTTGLNVAENLENPYKEFNCGEERGSSGFGGTPLPKSNPGVEAGKDTLWTPEALTKKFKAGNWTVNLKVIATAGTGGKGRVRCKLWKSPDKTTAFTGLGEVQALGEASLVIGEAKATALTFALEEAVLSNEYLGLQIAWQITSKATGGTANVRLRKGAEVKLTTAEEEAAEPATGRSSFGFRRDSKHRLIAKPSGTGRRKEGFARTSAGSLCTVTTGAARVINGLQVDSSGRVVISTGSVSKVREGLPRDSAGKLVTSTGTVTHVRNGFGLDSGGKVVVVEGA